MGVPKNFHEQVNLPKMVEALNDLNFYTFNYTIVLTEEYNKKLREAEMLNQVLDTELNVITRDGDLTLGCIKSFSAVDDETADKKMKEWLDVKIENNQILSYLIKSFESNTFKEELEEKGLDKLFYNS